ncbi:MAG TPA: adenylate kinase [Halanaerobiales bacterium]|nr:adenylate kinase [Halanaerobiales bacterium]
MNLIMLGLPGAGKGTQAKKLSNKYNIPHISTGDIFRNAIQNETELGKKAEEYLDSGGLVPDEITNNIVRERLKEDDCKEGFVLDGFPRTINQAEALEVMLENMGRSLDLALYINVTREELIKRLTHRRTCSNCGAVYHLDYDPPEKEGICDKCGGELIQRSDDKEEVVKERLKINSRNLKKLIEFYKNENKFAEVQSDAGIDEVFEKIDKIVKEKVL